MVHGTKYRVMHGSGPGVRGAATGARKWAKTWVAGSSLGCPDHRRARSRTEAWITGTSPVMTTKSRGFVLYYNRFDGTGQPWVEPGHDDEVNQVFASEH